MNFQFLDKPLNALGILIALLGITALALMALLLEGFKRITGQNHD